MKASIDINPINWFKKDIVAPKKPIGYAASNYITNRPFAPAPQALAIAPQPAIQEKTMSVKSVLDKIGTGFKDVFDFLGSTKGQAIVAAGESVVETIAPGTAGLINLANNWLTEIVKSEALAAAAAEQTGSGAQKGALVLSAVTPQALAFAQANGLPAPTATQLAAANTALVAFANAFATA